MHLGLTLEHSTLFGELARELSLHVPRNLISDDDFTFLTTTHSVAEVHDWLKKTLIREEKSPFLFFLIARNNLFSPEELSSIALSLSVSDSDQRAVAVLQGNLLFWAHLDTGSLPFRERCRLFLLAASNGHIKILEYLAKQSPGQVQDMIAASEYAAFRNAARKGHIEILEYLAKQSPGQVQDMIAASQYEAFRNAASNGQIKILEYLAKQSPDKVQDMIAAREYAAFRNAARKGHIEILEYLAKQSPEKVQDMIAAREYEAFRNAASNGHIEILEYLAKQSPEKVQDMIAARGYAAFRNAASNGHIEILEYLAKQSPDKVQDMIAAREYAAFRNAARKGHIETLEYLAKQSPDKVQDMIAASQYEAFCSAASNGHIETLEYLAKQSPGQVQDMIAASEYAAFRSAASNGHIETLEYLTKQSPDKVQDMIAASQYEAFRNAASNGHIETLEYLAKQSPDKVQDMIAASQYEAFRNAASNGHIETLEYLAKQSPDKVQNMIAASQYEAFWGAASDGHIKILEYLAKQSSDKVQDMIAASQYEAFRNAASNGHIETLEYLAKQSPDKVQYMIAAEDYSAFRDAAIYRNTEVLEYLMHFPSVFSYAERHGREFGDQVESFATKFITELKSRTKAEYPQTVYSQEEAQLCFYILRHFIRTSNAPNAPEIATQASLLLDIPSVKELLHRPLSGEREHNELLRLALTLGKRDWVATLMSSEGVASLAAQNNFYRDEAAGRVLDLQAIAQDHESSLRTLNAAEREFLKSLDELYPVLNATYAWYEMIGQVRSEYDSNPARVVLSRNAEQQQIALPIEYSDFEDLCKKNNMANDERVQANQAYYQHPVHTFLRFLMSPNPWMSPNAAYVLVDENGRSKRTANLRGYERLLTQLWKAASDKDAPACDGFDLKGRITEFFNSIALNARAHNWDKYRRVLRNGKSHEEQYDDLEGDKPSCYSGMLKRFVSSVKGHAILQGDLADYVNEYVRDRCYRSMKTRLSLLSTEMLESISLLIKLGAYDDEYFNALTRTLNISVEELSSWESALKKPEKTKELFDSSTSLLRGEERNDFIAGLGKYYFRELIESELSRRTDALHGVIATNMDEDALKRESTVPGKPQWLHFLFLSPPHFFKKMADEQKKMWAKLFGTLAEEQDEILIDCLHYTYQHQPELFNALKSSSDLPDVLRTAVQGVAEDFQIKERTDYDEFLKLCYADSVQSNLLKFIRDSAPELLDGPTPSKGRVTYSLKDIQDKLIKCLEHVNFSLSTEHHWFVAQLREHQFLDISDSKISYVNNARQEAAYDNLPSNPLCDRKYEFDARKAKESALIDSALPGRSSHAAPLAGSGTANITRQYASALKGLTGVEEGNDNQAGPSV